MPDPERTTVPAPDMGHGQLQSIPAAAQGPEKMRASTRKFLDIVAKIWIEAKNLDRHVKQDTIKDARTLNVLEGV